MNAPREDKTANSAQRAITSDAKRSPSEHLVKDELYGVLEPASFPGRSPREDSLLIVDVS